MNQESFKTTTARSPKVQSPTLRSISLPSSVQLLERPQKVLDFDTESLAAGFYDPQWVPQKITCIAWSWIGQDRVHVATCKDERGLYSKSVWRREMIQLFLKALLKADLVVGHNIIRHDLPVLNAECLRLGLKPLPPIKVQDTMRFTKTKGFLKGQDNIGALIDTHDQKMSLNWQQWDDAYAEPGWPTVIKRCKGDVKMHKDIYAHMLAEGWLKPIRIWRP